MLTAIIVLSALLPVMSIASFIIGYNINAPKKIMQMPKKQEEREPTETEKMLERIENAQVYTTRVV